MIGEGEKKHYVFIKDLNTFMYDQALHRGKKHFCRYYLQAFRTAEKLKFHIRFKKFGRKMKSLFIIYADFEIILGPKIMESKIQMSLILTNIKNVLLVVMVIN